MISLTSLALRPISSGIIGPNSEANPGIPKRNAEVRPTCYELKIVWRLVSCFTSLTLVQPCPARAT